MAAKKQKSSAKWKPQPSSMATFMLAKGRTRTVMVVAESGGGRYMVESPNQDGKIVRYWVKEKNLHPLLPGLFD